MFGQRLEDEELGGALELTDFELELLTIAENGSEPEPNRQLIPDGLDEWLPGPFLSAVLGSIDVTGLNAFDLVTVLRARARMISHHQAGLYGTISHVARAVPTGVDGPAERSEEWFEYTTEELRAALTLTRRAADGEIDLAYLLAERFPEVLERLAVGDIDLRRARTLVHGIEHLDDSEAISVVSLVIDEAAGLTTGQLAARIRKLCFEADPDSARVRYESGVADRRMVTDMNTDGTGNIMGLQLPVDRVSAVSSRIDRIAKSLKTKEEDRTLDQLRSDVFLDLLCGRAAGRRSSGGSVHLTAELSTLARLSETPGDVGGMGPVVAEISRKVAAAQPDGEWSYTVTDNGRPVATGTVRRRPTAAMKRHVRARYPTCVFPGCRMPATDCDLDHRVPWAEGGPTRIDHLGPMCRHDHVARHEAGWEVDLDDDGTYIFTSRLGHRYRTGGLPP